MSKIWTSTFKDDPENTDGFGYLYNELMLIKQYTAPALKRWLQDSVGNYPGEGADMEDLQLRTDLVDDSTIELVSDVIGLKDLGVGYGKFGAGSVGASKLGSLASYGSSPTRYVAFPAIFIENDGGTSAPLTIIGNGAEADLTTPNQYYTPQVNVGREGYVTGMTIWYSGTSPDWISLRISDGVIDTEYNPTSGVEIAIPANQQAIPAGENGLTFTIDISSNVTVYGLQVKYTPKRIGP